jgi:hypothetical protein
MKTIEIKFPTQIPQPVKTLFGFWPVKLLLVILGLVYAPILLMVIIGGVVGYAMGKKLPTEDKKEATQPETQDVLALVEPEKQENPYDNLTLIELEREQENPYDNLVLIELNPTD